MLIDNRKRQVIDRMAEVFSGKPEVKVAAREGRVDLLHAKMGELVVERDLSRVSGR
jgi:transposase